MERNGDLMVQTVDKTMTPADAARQLKIGVDYVYKLLYSEKLKGERVRKVSKNGNARMEWRVDAASVTARLKSLTNHKDSD